MKQTPPPSQIETGCLEPRQHREHICSLMEQGKTGEIKRRTDKPAFFCGNCGAYANEAADLCRPKPA